MNATLFYLHDPMCSWCWGYQPTWEALTHQLTTQFPTLSIEYIAGGLAPDTDQPMPHAQRQQIEHYWTEIANKLGTTFNHAFWQKNEPRRSTYPACRAVLAAKRQGKEYAMIRRIQEGYYLEARNPSNKDALIDMAKPLFNNGDLQQFIDDLSSPAIENALQQSIQQYREFYRHQLAQGFPSLVLRVDECDYAIPLDYQSPNISRLHIAERLNTAH